MSQKPDSKRYFKDLISAIIRDYELYGYCELIDELLLRDVKEFNVVDGSAFLVYRNFSQDLYANKYFESIDECVPCIQEVRSGQMLNWTKSNLHECKMAVKKETLKKIRVLGQEHHQEAIRKLKEEIEAAKTEAARIRQSAVQEAEQIKSDAKREADRIRAKAWEKENRLIKEGNAEKARIIENTNQIVEEQAQLERFKVREEYKEQAKQLLQKYLAEEQARIWREDARNAAQLSEEERTRFINAETAHKEMCDKTDQLQSNLIKEIDAVKLRMDDLKSEWYGQLKEWRDDLYPRDFKQLARRYQELYRTLNVQKLISETIVQIESTDGAAGGQIERLQKLQNSLEAFQRRFEKALNALNLYLFIPEEGEPYDELFHVCEEEECFEQDLVVDQCIIPGINKKTVDDEEIVILQARVSLKRK